MEVGSGVKKFKAGDKVVAMLSNFVSLILPCHDGLSIWYLFCPYSIVTNQH